MTFERTAAALRQAFDQSFAEPRSAPGELLQNFLAIRVGGEPYAVALSEIASLHTDRKVVPVPSSASAVLGVAAFRGTLAPVYDLRVLLGYASGSPVRWLMLIRTPELVGLAFDLFEYHLRTASGNVSSGEDGGAAAPHVRGAVRAADGVRPLIHVASLVEKITRHSSPDMPRKELNRWNGTGPSDRK
jgi:chemotaxis signal transduction protein